MVRERVEIVVVENGVRRVIRNIGLIGVAAATAVSPVNQLTTALRVLGLTVGVRGLLRTADAFTSLQNRVRLVTEGTEQLNNVTRELVDLSNRTRVSVEGSAVFFNRLSLSVKELGVNQQELLEITESVNQAIVISGATTKEAENGLIQLSQGLASGALRGDELRSILEQLPVIADVIAKEMGVTRGELRALGAEFLVTSDVIIRGFQNAREELSERFAKTVPTVGQALTVLSNSFTFFFGQMDTGLGVTRTLAQTLIQLALNLDTVAKALGTVVIALAALKLGKVVNDLFLLVRNTVQYITAVRSGQAVIIGSARALEQQAAAQLAVVAAQRAAAVQDVITARNALAITKAQASSVLGVGAGNLAAQAAAQTKFNDSIKTATVLTKQHAAAQSTLAVATANASKNTGILSIAFASLGRHTRNFLELVAGNPLRFFTSGLLTAVGLLFIFRNDLRLGQDKLVTLGDIGSVALRRLSESIGVVGDAFSLLIPRFADLELSFEGTLRFFARAIDSFLGLIRGLGLSVSDSFGQLFSSIEGSVASLGRGIASLARAVKASFTGNISFAEQEFLNADTAFQQGRDIFATAGEDFGRAAANGFDRGFRQTAEQAKPAETLLDSLIRSAEHAQNIRAELDRRSQTKGDPALAGLDAEQRGFAGFILQQLKDEGRLLALVNREQSIQRDLLEITNELKSKGVNLDSRPALRQRITEQLRLNQAIKEETFVIEEVTGKEREYQDQLHVVNRLLAIATKNTDKLLRKRRELTIASLELKVDVESGLERGLLKTQERLEDLASTGENLVVDAFQEAENALVKFARTGKLAFDDMINSILDGLARLASQALLNQLLNFGAGLFTPSNTVSAGDSFANSTTGSSVPSGASGFTGQSFAPPGGSTSNFTGGSIAPVVNVKVVTVLTPEDLADAMQGQAGERIVLHHIARNPKGVRTRIGN